VQGARRQGRVFVAPEGHRSCGCPGQAAPVQSCCRDMGKNIDEGRHVVQLPMWAPMCSDDQPKNPPVWRAVRDYVNVPTSSKSVTQIRTVIMASHCGVSGIGSTCTTRHVLTSMAPVCMTVPPIWGIRSCPRARSLEALIDKLYCTVRFCIICSLYIHPIYSRPCCVSKPASGPIRKAKRLHHHAHHQN
jgi:hypothetical protein